MEICAQAASDPGVFSRFRSETAYLEVLDHVTQSEGAKYLKVLRRDYPELLRDSLDELRANDIYGSPNTYQYPDVGQISPTTLRYAKVLGDLSRLFGDLTGRRIIEIGVGYGGQCRLITSRWPVQSYTLIDLKPALDLARVYLGKFANDPVMGFDQFEFKDPEADFVGPYDLCISNYAFTELSREMQEHYVGGVIRDSHAGYMICNFISGRFGIDSMSPEELLALHPGAQWLPEEPLTHPDNRILVWGRPSRER
ncbi:MAG: putative sugar O-methyltransferase [Chloroflexota bacterium]